jgi:hypothetical protein
MAILPSFYKEIHSPPRLGACYAQGRAVTTGRYGKEPQINTDERRYDYNNSINIFQLGLPDPWWHAHDRTPQAAARPYEQLPAAWGQYGADSGSVQEESNIPGVPCVRLRDNMERPETMEVGANVVAGTEPENPFGDERVGGEDQACYDDGY